MRLGVSDLITTSAVIVVGSKEGGEDDGDDLFLGVPLVSTAITGCDDGKVTAGCSTGIVK